MSVSPGSQPVLVSWLAVGNDPFNRSGNPGPTLTFLCDPDSPYRGVVEDAVIYYNSPDHRSINDRLETEIRDRSRNDGPTLDFRHLPVHPIDHKEIFEALRSEFLDLREEFAGRELAIHLSPGTAAAHTVWVLLAETGLIEPPFRLFQTLKRSDRSRSSPIQPVEIGLDTPLRSFQEPDSAPSVSDEGSQVRLNPSAYRSNRRQETFEKALRYSQLNVPILICGERGTGKSQLADWIRLNSPYRQPENDNSPPKVACGQFTGDLVRSEIFGHREGAFTGATSDRDGLLKTADGDTLFLDEIGDLSQKVQRLLIRAVENKEYTPHGADEVLESDFRLITATNLPWHELEEVLAADFLDRISYFTIRMPSLRDTPEDLPVLWKRVLQVAADRAQVQSSIVEEILDNQELITSRLKSHPLPGNFRDLFSLAYHIFAEVGAQDAEIESAVRIAMEESFSHPKEPSNADQTERIRRHFGDGHPLPMDLLEEEDIDTTAALNRLRRYLAEEIRRLSGESEEISDPSTICDVSRRSLQKWSDLQ